MKRLKEDVDALRGLNLPELAERYRELFGREPRCRSREHLWKRIAWKLEEQRSGGLSGVAKRKLEELMAEIQLPSVEKKRSVAGVLKSKTRREGPQVGTTLVREWKGKRIAVRVTEGGYEHQGTVYRSLSAVAKAITGTIWNGRLFFNLTTRKAKK